MCLVSISLICTRMESSPLFSTLNLKKMDFLYYLALVSEVELSTFTEGSPSPLILSFIFKSLRL